MAFLVLPPASPSPLPPPSALSPGPSLRPSRRPCPPLSSVSFSRFPSLLSARPWPRFLFGVFLVCGSPPPSSPLSPPSVPALIPLLLLPRLAGVLRAVFPCAGLAGRSCLYRVSRYSVLFVLSRPPPLAVNSTSALGPPIALIGYSLSPVACTAASRVSRARL